MKSYMAFFASALFASTVAHAETIRDPATGFEIKPVAGYTTEVREEAPFKVVVMAPDRNDMFFCLFVVSDLPPEALSTKPEGPTLEETNRMGEDNVETIQDDLDGFTFSATEPYKIGPVEGVTFTATETASPISDWKDAVSQYWLFVTPTGRTSINCMSSKPKFEADRAIFEKIVNSASLPTKRLPQASK